MFLNLFGNMSKNMETESLWDETIDDIALSQATNEIECEYLFGELILGQLSVLNTCMGHFDLNESFTVDSMIDMSEDNFQCKQEETARFAFLEDPDITSTESKNTRKNTKWVFSVFMEWRKARMATKVTLNSHFLIPKTLKPSRFFGRTKLWLLRIL